MMRSAFCLLSVCLLASCSSVNYMGIETYNAAEVTFPENVGRILVVNNALPQPEKSGYEYKLFGTVQDTARMEADSALFDACRGLGKAIVNASFFNDVLLYHEPTRKDTRYYEDIKLTEDQVEALCNETGTDAVIAVDRLLFETKKDVVAYAEGYVSGDLDVKISGVIRAYLPGRPNPLATVYMSDSLFWGESAGNLVMLERILPPTTDAIRAAGEYIGMKASPNFVPHWADETRWYYTGIGARWKEATAYAESEKWDKAMERWSYLYKNSSKAKNRAKAAANIALCHELKNELKEAHEWASKSYDLFKKNGGEDSSNAKLLSLYVEVLSNRIHSDKKLNMQFGE